MSSQNGPTSFLPDDTMLPRPHEASLLADRMSVLTGQRLLSFAERAEVAGIWAIMWKGSVVAGELREALLTYYHFAPTHDEGEWLQPVRDDQRLAWQRLSRLVAGESVEEDPADEASETSAHELHIFEWVRSVMHTLTVLADGHQQPYDFELADMLPAALIRRIRRGATEEWFGSPYALGEAMEALPSNGCGAFGNKDQGVYVLDAYARAVFTALAEYEQADGKEKSRALGRADMWWMILKGMVYSMLSTRLGRSLPGMLVKHQEVFGRISLALSQGRDMLQTAQQAGVTFIPVWTGRPGAASAAMTTEDLIHALSERIAQEEAEMEALRRFH